MAEVEQTIGTVVANATVNVSSQVDGKVAKAEFQEGDLVKEGDVLFRLDPRPFEAALDQARANLARDRAQLVNALQDRARYDRLFKQNAISAQQRDQVTAQAGALAGSVKADEAAVALARLHLDYSVIRAPMNGKTGPILIQPGNLVKANSNTLVVLTQIQPIKISFSLPQTDLPRLQKQMAKGALVAETTPHGAGGKTIHAKVDFIDNTVNAESGTIQLRATVPNRDGRLVPGELVDISVNLADLKQAIVVPSQAVNVGPDGHYVWVVGKDDTARMRPVNIRYDNGTDTAITGKVTAGERVITVGQLRVEPGAPVSIVKNGNGANGQTP
jgi:multidrug efflux system membrane fusion protein